MQKLTVDYDPSTGNVILPDGFMVDGAPLNAVYPDAVSGSLVSGGADSTAELVKLKSAGFTAAEIIELKTKNLV